MRSRRASALRALGDPETPAAPWAASKRAVRHTRVGRMTSPRKIIRVVNEKPDAKRLVPHRTVERSLSPCNQHVSTLPCPGSSGRPYGPVPRSSQVRPAHVGSVWFYILVQVAKTLRARVQTRRMVAADSGRRPPTLRVSAPGLSHCVRRGTIHGAAPARLYTRRSHIRDEHTVNELTKDGTICPSYIFRHP
jgi:hypothetical protein